MEPIAAGADPVNTFRNSKLGWLSATIALTSAAPAAAQLQWTSKDEKTTFKLGFLAQLQLESAEVPGTDDEAQNIFLRRMRLIGQFTLGDELAVFAQTDSPNLGKSASDGTKTEGDIFLQDLIATWKFSQGFSLDGGLLLDRKSTRLNSSHLGISYAVFC